MAKFPVMIGTSYIDAKRPENTYLERRYGYVPLSYDIESWLGNNPKTNEDNVFIRAIPYMQRLGVESQRYGTLHCHMFCKGSTHMLDYTLYDYHANPIKDLKGTFCSWENLEIKTESIAMDRQLQLSIDAMNQLSVLIKQFLDYMDAYIPRDFNALDIPYDFINEYQRLCKNIKITQEAVEYVFQKTVVTPSLLNIIYMLLIPMDNLVLLEEAIPEDPITPEVDNTKRNFGIVEDKTGIQVEDKRLNVFLDHSQKKSFPNADKYLVHNDLQMIYSIFDYLARHKIRVRRCKECRRIFFPEESNEKYCSEECRKMGRIRRNRRSCSKNAEEHNFAQRLIKRYDKYHENGMRKEFDLGCLHIPEEDMNRSVPFDLLESLNEERRKIVSGLENVVYRRYNHRRFVQLVNQLIQYQQKRRNSGLISGDEYLKWITMSGRKYNVK